MCKEGYWGFSFHVHSASQCAAFLGSPAMPPCSRAVGIVYMGERLNKLGARHWRSFAGQNYFDPRGVFYSVMVSGPLMLAMFIVLVGGPWQGI